MNIYDYAIQMEKDGEAYYRELGQKSNAEGLQFIFTILADEEVSHYTVLEKLKESDPNATLSEKEQDVLKSAKNIFAEMHEKMDEINFNLPQVEFYRKALETEEKSIEYYLEMSEKVEDEAHKAIFLKLAKEEKKHKFLMENLVNFISRPITWLEDAEFNHLEDY